jgi:DNA-binding NtrC family response regulator/tetratricopeptide (TPR) repeat protein
VNEVSAKFLAEIRALTANGHFAQAHDHLVEADLGLQSINPDTSGEVVELFFLCLHHLGRWDEIVDSASKWIPTLVKSNSSRALARVHASSGIACLRLGQIRRAEEHIRAAIHVAVWDLDDREEALGHQRKLVVMFKNLGYWHQARFEAQNGIEVADQIGSDSESGALRMNLVIAILKSGTLNPVPDLLDEAEKYLERAARPNWLLIVHLLRARYLVLTHHPNQALEILTPILATTREQRYSREEAICLEYMGDCRLLQREYRQALDHYNAALQIADATAPKGDLIPELGHRIAEALVNLGDPNAAILSCERGLRVARDTGDRYEECATHRVLAMANWAAGNPRKAIRLAMEGIELGRSYEIPYELARTIQWLGEARLQGNAPDEKALGRRQLWEARSIFERLGLPYQARHLEKLLGFETQPEPQADEPGIGALADLENLDRGALRFGIITCSPDVSEAVATIQGVAPSRIPVLITGQSGVGKELLAKALHLMSDRRKGPFIPINCGAVSPNLIDSEFFGHERGAFTGAVSSREGLIASAHTGTLFLDEIGELSSAAQSTLLRVLETGELRPLGRDDVRTIDVRIVAATNASLDELVERGVFRRDLYYRLNGVSVSLPQLQDREEDVRALFRYFWAQAIATSKKSLTLANDVEAMLCAYAWPGNVRELKHEIARVVALAESGTIVSRDAFLPKERAKSAERLLRDREHRAEVNAERDAILRALRAHQGNKAEAARSLGNMKRTTLIYKIQTHRIRPEEYLLNE